MALELCPICGRPAELVDVAAELRACPKCKAQEPLLASAQLSADDAAGACSCGHRSVVHATATPHWCLVPDCACHKLRRPRLVIPEEPLAGSGALVLCVCGHAWRTHNTAIEPYPCGLWGCECKGFRALPVLAVPLEPDDDEPDDDEPDEE